MMRFLFFMLCLFVFPVLAWAQDEALCRLVADYNVQAPSGISAEYQPGVDVHGVPVAAADVNPLDAGIDVVNIPITVDLAQRFNLVLPQGIELKPDVGMISIYKDGRVAYNGQDLSGPAVALCSKRLPTETQSEQTLHGQGAGDPLPSTPETEIIEGQYTE
ncbi:MAG: hypothetical protein KDI46_05160 [Alphaproteobacteria bacterium]|nr:hypothetical protein [Alphaproteobacteria bacterium]